MIVRISFTLVNVRVCACVCPSLLACFRCRCAPCSITCAVLTWSFTALFALVSFQLSFSSFFFLPLFTHVHVAASLCKRSLASLSFLLPVSSFCPFFFRKYSVFSFARADGAGGIRYHCNGEANKRNHSRVTPASSSSSTAFSPPQKTILRER